MPDSQQSFAPTNSDILGSTRIHSDPLGSSMVASQTPEPAAATQGYGMTTSQAIKAHKPDMLDFNFEDLPDYEVYEMNGKGLSVLKNNKRYAEFFKEVCLE